MSGLDLPPGDVEAIERATVAAVAHDACQLIGPWILAHRPGTIGRARSAAPLTHTLVRDESLLSRIEAAYRAQDMTAEFRMPDVEGLSGVAGLLAERGYRPEQPTLVMAASVAQVAAVAEPRAICLETPDEAWANVFLGQGFDPVDGAHRVQTLSRAPDAVFAAVRDEAGTYAVGVAAFAAGWASLHGMRTAEARRGEGLAGQVMARLAAEAAARGVERIFLQVEEANAPARALYARAGFSALWRYRYWRRP